MGCLDRFIYKLLYVVIDNVLIANLSIIVLGLIHLNIVITILRFVVSGEEKNVALLVQTGCNHSIRHHLRINDTVIAAYVNIEDVSVSYLLHIDRTTDSPVQSLAVSLCDHITVCGLQKDCECTLVAFAWGQIYIGCLEYGCCHSRLSQTTAHNSKESLTLICVHITEWHPDVWITFSFKGTKGRSVYPRQPGGLACNGSSYLIKSIRQNRRTSAPTLCQAVHGTLHNGVGFFDSPNSTL